MPTIAACLFLTLSAPTAQDGYLAYRDWHHWARWMPGARAGLASSWDRTGSNDDWNWYESPAGFVNYPATVTVKTIEGPGVLYRWWMPHQTANQGFVTRMYMDGETRPRIDTTSDAFFAGKYAYITAPLVDACAGGQVSYEPIAFAKSLRIEVVTQQIPPNNPYADNRHYYQFSYLSLPAASAVESYTGVLSPSAQAEREAVATMFERAGSHPGGEEPNTIDLRHGAACIAPGEIIVLASATGTGTVRRVCIAPGDSRDVALDALRLVVRYDGGPAAIDVPVAEFFGAGHERATYRSIPMGTQSSDGYYCYWPMPFRNSIEISLVNTAAFAIDIVGARVEYETGVIRQRACYLHATRSESTQDGNVMFHPMMSAVGRGQYVGNLLYMDAPTDAFYMLECDEQIAVDGRATMNGTGTEDAYNGGYYYNWVRVVEGEPEGVMPQSATRALSGALYVRREAGVMHARADQYRWQIADRVPFDQSIDVRMEFGFYAVPGTRWTSVAFWYLQPDLRGDVDDDGDIDNVDRDILLAVLLGMESQARHLQRADINGNGSVDGDDIAEFVRAAAEPQ